MGGKKVLNMYFLLFFFRFSFFVLDEVFFYFMNMVLGGRLGNIVFRDIYVKLVDLFVILYMGFLFFLEVIIICLFIESGF